jgi:hypothetical protein
MYPKPEVIRQINGKSIRDSYGRKYGLILGVTENAKKDVLVWIRQSNGDLSSYPFSQITYDDNSLILNTSWTVQAKNVETELTTAFRKISVLNKLYNDGEIPKEAYLKIQEQNENLIQSLTKRYELLINSAKVRLETLNSQLEHMELLLANLKIDRVLEIVNENDYSALSRSLQLILNHTLVEKKDIEITLKELYSGSSEPPLTSEDGSIQPILLRIQESES